MAPPLVIYGPRSLDYDFGPSHPLTPRRFGPGISLLRALGADEPTPPEPATDAQLERLHDPGYIAAVQEHGLWPGQMPPSHGIGPGDDPPFYGMHEAAAAVAGGSLAGMEAILSGRTDHAFHPGGGLHHAHRDFASGFCIYNDAALAIARARDAGHRVLYVDLDVHHGDGVQSLFWNDREVLTCSFHENGLFLFPGSGSSAEQGGPQALGRAVNVPLLPGTGDRSWWASVERLVPALAEAYRPTVLVSQHGCDSHAYDPLAHLRLTTAAYARATRLLHELAHRYTGGRWLATGGGGYDAYRVVPRSWALVWLAQCHQEVPSETPASWREQWVVDAARYDQGPPPAAMIDPPDLVGPEPDQVAEAADQAVALALEGLDALRDDRSTAGA
jgi:acetoin utilization protein AcuC